MEYIMNLFLSHKKIFIPILSFLVFIFVFLIVQFIFNSRLPHHPSSIVTPPPQNTQLNEQEKQYREAEPQEFKSYGTTIQYGTLVITSNPDEVRIRIDLEGHEASQDSVVVPRNTTPFKVSRIPVGTHTLFAAKPGYEIIETTVTIEPGVVTRLNLTLNPF